MSSSLFDEETTRMVTSAPGTLWVLKNELTLSSRNEPNLVLGNPGGETEKKRIKNVVRT